METSNSASRCPSGSSRTSLASPRRRSAKRWRSSRTRAWGADLSAARRFRLHTSAHEVGPPVSQRARSGRPEARHQPQSRCFCRGSRAVVVDMGAAQAAATARRSRARHPISCRSFLNTATIATCANATSANVGNISFGPILPSNPSTPSCPFMASRQMLQAIRNCDIAKTLAILDVHGCSAETYSAEIEISRQPTGRLRRPVDGTAWFSTGVTKSFGTTRALSDVDLDVAAGEAHAAGRRNGLGTLSEFLRRRGARCGVREEAGMSLPVKSGPFKAEQAARSEVAGVAATRGPKRRQRLDGAGPIDFRSRHVAEAERRRPAPAKAAHRVSSCERLDAPPGAWTTPPKGPFRNL